MQKSIPPPSTAAKQTSNASARVDVESKTTKHPMVETSEPRTNATPLAIAATAQDTSRNYPQATDVERDANVSLSDQGEVESAHFIQEMSLQFPEADNPLSSVFSAIGAIGNTIGRATLRSREIVAFFLSANFIVLPDALGAVLPTLTQTQSVASTASPSPREQKMSGLKRAQLISDIVPTALIIISLVAYAIYKGWITVPQTREMNGSQIQMTLDTRETKTVKAKTELAEELRREAADPDKGYPDIARSMLPKMACSFVEQAVKFVTDQQLEDALAKTSKVTSMVNTNLKRQMHSKVKVTVQRLRLESIVSDNKNISKSGAAEISGKVAGTVTSSEGGKIAKLLVAEGIMCLSGKLGGHVTREGVQKMVQDAVRKKFEKEGHVENMATSVNQMISSELYEAGIRESSIWIIAESAEAVTKDEAANIIIGIIGAELSKLVDPLVLALAKSAAQDIDGMEEDIYREILKHHWRVNKTSFKDDFNDKLKSLEPKQNRMEERKDFWKVCRSIRASLVELNPVFMFLALCAMLLKMELNPTFELIEGKKYYLCI